MATLKPFEAMRDVQAPTTARGLGGIQPSASPSLFTDWGQEGKRPEDEKRPLVVPSGIGDPVEGGRETRAPGPEEPVLKRGDKPRGQSKRMEKQRKEKVREGRERKRPTYSERIHVSGGNEHQTRFGRLVVRGVIL
jgi:hypothetical protein